MSVNDFYGEAFPPEPQDNNPLRFSARAFQERMDDLAETSNGSPEPKQWSEAPTTWPGPGKGVAGESSN